MAVSIMNNSGTMLALGQMKKNDSDLSKQLKKIASGMRINSAGDDASGYSISERMRTMIRALGQDIQNVKTGINLVAVAEGGIQEIINNLRSMKEMAINSANDHNTDLDRETLEKEFSSRLATITDITATTNYNGRLLLTGDYAQYHVGIGIGGTVGNTLITDFQPAFNTCTSNYQTKRVSGGLHSSVPVDSSYVGTGRGTWNYWTAIGQQMPGTAQRSQIAVSMDFSGLSINYPSALDGTGFCIACGDCSQYINIIFDASTTATTYTSTPAPPPGKVSNSFAREFTIGVQNVTNSADLAKAIFDGIQSVQSQIPLSMYQISNAVDTTSSNILIDTFHYLRLAEINGSYYFLKNDDKHAIQFINGVYGGPRNEFDIGFSSLGTPLIIHTGPKANQQLRIFINGMYPKNMGIEDAHVIPQEYALAAMGLLDDAIDYALNEITRMGAYRMRLGQTEENLVTNEENTQSAESSIRDANMAKEMTAYTKANVLSQAAQSMLAQANTNSSQVLSLLQ